MRGFLGLSSYYRIFIKGYASLVTILTNLFKRDVFHWSETTTATFQNLKSTITSKPVLALPNFDLPFKVEIDASGIGIGVVLS